MIVKRSDEKNKNWVLLEDKEEVEYLLVGDKILYERDKAGKITFRKYIIPIWTLKSAIMHNTKKAWEEIEDLMDRQFKIGKYKE